MRTRGLKPGMLECSERVVLHVYVCVVVGMP